jgi:threonine/homoserine/homoserine lactone efflux protein
MSEVIGALLPLAIGIAISPVPIIAAILMLLSPQAGATSVGFMIGWVVGIVFSTLLFLGLATAADMSAGSEPSTAASWVKIVLGVLLILLGLRQWQSRPQKGETAKLPTWMQAIDKVTTAKAVGLGFLLCALNPKNLGLSIAAGVVIAQADLSTSDSVIAVIFFVVLASTSVVIPVLGYSVAKDRMREPLNELRGWLVQNNATVMTILLTVMGTVVLGQGIGGLH